MKSALFVLGSKESTIDFEGHLSLVFFTKGCNFSCSFCHNPELLPAAQGENISYEELGGILDRARENWVDAVCITGGEPTLQRQLPETASFIKSRGAALKIDTQGSLPEKLSTVLPYCDYVAMDYKMPLADYHRLTGVSVNPEKIKSSLSLLKASAADYEMRTTVIPGIHTEEHIRRMAVELEGVKKYVLQAFVPRENLPDENLRKQKKTPPAMLEQYADICRGYLENVIVR